jgi:hypothetical protein
MVKMSESGLRSTGIAVGPAAVGDGGTVGVALLLHAESSKSNNKAHLGFIAFLLSENNPPGLSVGKHDFSFISYFHIRCDQEKVTVEIIFQNIYLCAGIFRLWAHEKLALGKG